MKLNRTGSNWTELERNKINENWDGLEQLGDSVTDLVLESGGDSNLEVVQARGGERVLNDRLDKMEYKIEEKADQAYVNDELNNRVTKQEFQDGLAPKADQTFVDAQLASIVSGAPKGTFATLQALIDAYPNGTEGIFLVLSDGHWYYWNENDKKWTDGGLYQSQGIGDNTITPEKTTFIKQTKNLWDGRYVAQDMDGSAGSLFLFKQEGNELGRLAIVSIEPGKTYTVRVHDKSISNTLRIASDIKIPKADDYDINDRYYFKTFITLQGSSGMREYTFTNNDDRFLFIFSSTEGNEPRIQVEEGATATPFVEHAFLEEGLLKEDSIKNKHLTVKSVQPKNTTFFDKTKNIFDGNFENIRMDGSAVNLFIDGNSQQGTTAIIRIEPNKTYTIKVHTPSLSDFFAVGTSSLLPVYDKNNRYYMNNSIYLAPLNSGDREITFTNGFDELLYVCVSTINQEGIELQVEEGESASSYTEPFYMDAKYIKNMPSLDTKKDIYEELRGNIYQRNYRVDKLFKSDDGVVAAGDVTLTDVTDTVYLKNNTSSVKMTVNSPTNVRIDFPLSNPIDLYKRMFALYFYLPPESSKTPRQAKFSVLAVYLTTPEGLFIIYPESGNRRYPGWNSVIGNPFSAETSSVSEENLREVTNIRIHLNADSAITEPYDIYFDSLVSWDDIRKPTVLLEFDDAINSVYANAFPLMAERGMRGATHVITKNITTPDPSYISNEGLLRMHDVGWDICSHSVNHQYISELTEEQQLFELEQSQKDLLSLGLRNGPQFYVAPYGDNTLYAVEQARKFYQNYRMTGYRPAQPAMPVLPYAMECINAGSRGLEGVTQLVDKAAEKGGDLPVMWHGEIGETWGGIKWEGGE